MKGSRECNNVDNLVLALPGTVSVTPVCTRLTALSGRVAALVQLSTAFIHMQLRLDYTHTHTHLIRSFAQRLN